MALWTRYPQGVYTRPSTEWWSHRRGRCSLNQNPDVSGNPLIYGLYNDSSPGVYLHVIGVVIEAESEGIPVYNGRFYTGPPPNAVFSSPGQISPTSGFYSNDPMPPGVGVFGSDASVTFNDALTVIAGSLPAYFYPTNEISVLAPNDTFAFYVGEGLGFFNIMFEWYWSED